MTTLEELRNIVIPWPGVETGQFEGAAVALTGGKVLLFWHPVYDAPGFPASAGDRDELIQSDPLTWFSVDDLAETLAVFAWPERLDFDWAYDRLFESWRRQSPDPVVAAWDAVHPIMDIEAVVVEALRQRQTWSEVRMKSCLDAFLKAVPSAAVDWECGVENWASVFENARTILMLSAVIPVCFCREDYVSKFQALKLDCVVSCIPFDSDDRTRFRISQSVLQDLRGSDITDMPWHRLRLSDIWYATIT